ncbi:hypothetical protein AJ80_03000 [Polytolypa hystricis UAMH7299]|uniref:RAD52 homolog n=1 Tax=Polytolypa hystricis (strain UAMH7299) TaxID=1447883 RepID=A0A2B7YPG5_POLH7|nr:hypothetical protein AJ80_03000 [Polytolypa hystricis UAMH7299]
MSTAQAAVISANPFEPFQPRINKYTEQEIMTIQSRLNKQLGPEYISSRQGPGGVRVHYLAAEKSINLANEVFGFNGWSSSIQNIQIDFCDENPNTGKINVGLHVVVRVTLKDGTFHEDIGYGHIENCKGKAAAFDKAKKEGTTDALKRTLRTFGKALGNCIYDKEYLAKVTKLKVVPTKWDVDGLYRHADYAPVKKDPQPPAPEPKMHTSDLDSLPSRLPNTEQSEETLPLEFEGDFGSDLFDEADFAETHAEDADDTLLLEPEPPVQQKFVRNQGASTGYQPQRNPGPPSRVPNHMVTPSKPERPPAAGPAPVARPPLPPSNSNHLSRPINSSLPAHNPSNVVARTPVQSRPQPPTRIDNPVGAQNPNPSTIQPPYLPSNQLKPNNNTTNASTSPTKQTSPPNSQIPEDKRPEDPVGGFYSARAADTLRNNPYAAPKIAPTFDLRYESPSLRRTAGFNHNTSAPVARKTHQIVQPQFSENSPRPAGSQTVGKADDSAPDTIRRPGLSAPGNNNNGMASPAIRNPMTTSYRPPSRRVVTRSGATPGPPTAPSGATSANTNAATAAVPQNVNGKRPPLTDMTNGQPGAGATEDAGDPAKKARLANGASGTHTAQAQQQQQQK